MTIEPSDEPWVCHGSDWPEHEDFLIGNEEGFRNLISACEEAMKSGEAKSDSIGEFVGVRLVDAEWAERQNSSTNSLFGKVVGGGISGRILRVSFCRSIYYSFVVRLACSHNTSLQPTAQSAGALRVPSATFGRSGGG